MSNQNSQVVQLDRVRGVINSEYVQKKFQELLGERSSSFLASVLNAVSSNALLSKAEPKSILTAAMAAAVLNLPVDKNLGFAAIVPYNEKGRTLAQFQIMTRGYIQLAQRSGRYAKMNVTEVYQDEFVSYNYVTGDLELKPSPAGGQRDVSELSKIVGYVAYFKLDTGFEKMEYWPIGKIDAHGKRFSKSYGKETGVWVTNKEAMRAKTVLKNTIAKWGPLSIELQKAVSLDQRVAGEQFSGGDDLEGTMTFADNPGNISDVGDVVSDDDEFSVEVKETDEMETQAIKAEQTDKQEGPVLSKAEKEFLNLDRAEMVAKIVAVIETTSYSESEMIDAKTTLKADLKKILKGQPDEKELILGLFRQAADKKAKTKPVAPGLQKTLDAIDSVRDAIEALPEDKKAENVVIEAPKVTATQAQGPNDGGPLGLF